MLHTAQGQYLLDKMFDLAGHISIQSSLSNSEPVTKAQPNSFDRAVENITLHVGQFPSPTPIWKKDRILIQ